MKCTSTERETCQEEKMGCEGCAYDEPLVRELTEIEYHLTQLARQNNLLLDIHSLTQEDALGNPYSKVYIDAFKKLK